MDKNKDFLDKLELILNEESIIESVKTRQGRGYGLNSIKIIEENGNIEIVNGTKAACEKLLCHPMTIYRNLKRNEFLNYPKIKNKKFKIEKLEKPE